MQKQDTYERLYFGLISGKETRKNVLRRMQYRLERGTLLSDNFYQRALDAHLKLSKVKLYEVATNDADYTLSNAKTGWLCPYYTKWKQMLKRCYCKTELERNPTYKGCSVCEEWLTFSNFKSWMEQQDWEGKCLDKDLLVFGNKLYSPETCVFVDQPLNNFLIKRDKFRGDFPLGVHFKNDIKRARPFTAQGRENNTSVFLGYYFDPIAAHKAWQVHKIQLANRFLVCETNPEIIKGITRVIDKISNDLFFGIETKDF